RERRIADLWGSPRSLDPERLVVQRAGRHDGQSVELGRWPAKRAALELTQHSLRRRQCRRSIAASCEHHDMSIHTSNPQSTDKPGQTPGRDVAKRYGLTLLSETELDQVAAATSKPGMVGDGRQPLQLLATR